MSAQTDSLVIDCPLCQQGAKALRLPANRGTIKVKCSVGHQFFFDTAKNEWWHIDHPTNNKKPASIQYGEKNISATGDLSDAQIEQMVLHAKKAWGALKMDRANTPTGKARIWAFARKHGVKVTGYKPTDEAFAEAEKIGVRCINVPLFKAWANTLTLAGIGVVALGFRQQAFFPVPAVFFVIGIVLVWLAERKNVEILATGGQTPFLDRVFVMVSLGFLLSLVPIDQIAGIGAVFYIVAAWSAFKVSLGRDENLNPQPVGLALRNSGILQIFFLALICGVPAALLLFLLNGMGLMWPVLKFCAVMLALFAAGQFLIAWMDTQQQPAPVAPPRGSGEFGEAGFASWDEANACGLFPADSAVFAPGIYLQKFVQAISPEGRYLKSPADQQEADWHLSYSGENHLITVAPPGAGKGTCAIIPTLRGCTESIVALDVKGELYDATAAYRKQRLGHRIIRINPLNVLNAGTHRFNPLAFVDPKKEDECTLAIQSIAQALVPHDKDKPFFSNRARSLICAVLGKIVWEEKRKGKTATLPMLSKVLHLSGENLAAWLLEAADVCPLVIVRENAASFIGSGDMIESVKATALQGLEFLKLPAIADFLSGHDFNFRDLRTQKATVYFMIPLHALGSMSFFIRLMVQVAFADFERFEDKNKNRVLLILDEVAQLGNMEKITNAYSIMRGYSLRVWSIFQDLNQMKGVYPDRWESMLSSADIAQFFTPNDMFTAKWLSEHIGDSTVTTTGQSNGFSTGTDAQGRPTMNQNQGTNTGKRAQKFMSPQDLLGLPKNRGLLFKQGLQYPILTTRTPYFDANAAFKD